MAIRNVRVNDQEEPRARQNSVLDRQRCPAEVTMRVDRCFAKLQQRSRQAHGRSPGVRWYRISCLFH
jgi:hypothetical protein